MAKQRTFDVVGLQFRVTPATMETMADVVPLKARIRRDSQNAADKNALEVFIMEKPWMNFHLGYLRRQVASELAPRMDAGRLVLLDAVVESIDTHHGEASVSLKLQNVK